VELRLRGSQETDWPENMLSGNHTSMPNDEPMIEGRQETAARIQPSAFLARTLSPLPSGGTAGQRLPCQFFRNPAENQMCE